MNKPYFTKYIDIECPQLAKQSIGSSCNRNNQCIFPSCTKRLFLCSRDVQVGDKCIDGEGDEVIIIKDNEDRGDGFRVRISDAPILECFKVIGEISPDAVWVAEGMEFSEDEIRDCLIHEERGSVVPLPDVDKEELSNWKSNNGYVRGVQIKGCCGHFH